MQARLSGHNGSMRTPPLGEVQLPLHFSSSKQPLDHDRGLQKSTIMSNAVKTYFLAPNWDLPPGGPVVLGSIIANPRKPERSLNKSKQVTIPSNNILTSYKSNWQATRVELRASRVGIWASFLQLVGIGGDIDFNHKHDTNEVYKCERLETESFQPDDAYIHDSLQNPMVKSYIEASWPVAPVYMIIGIKIAQGFNVTSGDVKGHGSSAKVGVDAMPAGVPLTGGPKVEYTSSKTWNTSFDGSSKCVFAYRLIKIRSRKDDTINEEDFNRGALLNTDEKEEESIVDGLHDSWEIAEVNSGNGPSGLVVRSDIDEDNEIAVSW